MSSSPPIKSNRVDLIGDDLTLIFQTTPMNKSMHAFFHMTVKPHLPLLLKTQMLYDRFKGENTSSYVTNVGYSCSTSTVIIAIFGLMQINCFNRMHLSEMHPEVFNKASHEVPCHLRVLMESIIQQTILSDAPVITDVEKLPFCVRQMMIYRLTVQYCREC